MNRKNSLLIAVFLAVIFSMSAFPAGVEVSLMGAENGFIYRTGHLADIRVSLSSPAYLIVYGLDSDGDIKILFPNIDTPNNYVTQRSISLTRHHNMLADEGGPLFIFAIASPDRRMSFHYQDRTIPLWSNYWPPYHPVYSFVPVSGYGGYSGFPVVLGRHLPIQRDSRYPSGYYPGGMQSMPYEQISDEFGQFYRIVDYFIDDLNGAVVRFNFPYYYGTAELYVHNPQSSYGYNTIFDSYLNPYGYWVFLDGLRVWKPYVSYRWKPFVHGYWRWSGSIRDWVWISFEPWNLTYYYGYWYFDLRHGWVWIPDMQWHAPRVVFYYVRGYVGWRPAPLPNEYHSRINGYSFNYRDSSHNPYVFVSSKDFTSSDVSSRVLPDHIYTSQIRPRLGTSRVQEFQEGVKFLEKVMPAERLTVRTVDLEKTKLDTGGSQPLEAMLPKLDSREKTAVKSRQGEILSEVKAQKKSAPQQETDQIKKPAREKASSPLTERSKIKNPDGPIKIEKTR